LGLRQNEEDDDELSSDAADAAEDAVVDSIARLQHMPQAEEGSDGNVVLTTKQGKVLATLSQEKFSSIAEIRKRKRQEKARLEAERKPLKDMEHALRKQLGRRLTWGEKNQIALGLVSTLWRCVAVCLGLTFLSSVASPRAPRCLGRLGEGH
jgi:hypothetical protein